ncbi:MAG: hydrogen gas-evolving membrane-bound hydrogenase subunit E [Chromatiaceae bacterium]|jgi:multicomponent Na+:H+ antiporter subunit B
MRNLASLVFTAGLAFLLLVIASQLGFGHPPMRVGQGILAAAPAQVGAANIVTAVVSGYRGFDTLGELSVLFAAATAIGLVLGRRRSDAPRDPAGGFILSAGGDLLFPLLLVVGFYIIVHGHLTPGGGFQGGVILAAAFFVAVLARPDRSLGHAAISWIEGLAGASFILIGLWALVTDGEFLKPLLVDKGTLGHLVSAGTLPLLSIAIGLKVGAELAGLMAQLSDAEASDR